MTFAADLEREKAQQRTYDAMARKAKAGHVTGGRLFGYDNIDVRDASGQRSHVERRINETEAAVIRRIFAALRRGARRQGHRQDPERGGGAVPAGATRALAVVGADVRPGSAPPGRVPRARSPGTGRASGIGGASSSRRRGPLGLAEHSGAGAADRGRGCLAGGSRTAGRGTRRLSESNRRARLRPAGARGSVQVPADQPVNLRLLRWVDEGADPQSRQRPQVLLRLLGVSRTRADGLHATAPTCRWRTRTRS